MKSRKRIALVTLVACLLLSSCGQKSKDTHAGDPRKEQTSTSDNTAQAQEELSTDAAKEKTPSSSGSEMEWYANIDHTVKATFDGAHTLTFSGNGEVCPFLNEWTFVGQNHTPWIEYVNQITKVVVEEGITEIGFMSLSFLGRNIELELPASLVELGEPLTDHTTEFKSIKVASGSKRLMVRDGALYYINDAGMYELVRYCTALDATSFSLPQDIAVCAVWQCAFIASNNLKQIDVSQPTLSVIGEEAFGYSDVEELHLPENLDVDLDTIAPFCSRLETVTGGAG